MAVEGRNTMEELYKVTCLNFTDEYEGYFSFFLPGSDDTILARCLGNVCEYAKGDYVSGSFSVDSEMFTHTEYDDQIRQNQEYTTDTRVLIIGTIVSINGKDCVIRSKGISIESSPEKSR